MKNRPGIDNIVPGNSAKSRYIISNHYIIDQNPEYIKTWISRPQPNWLPAKNISSNCDKIIIQICSWLMKTRPGIDNIVPENSAKSR